MSRGSVSAHDDTKFNNRFLSAVEIMFVIHNKGESMISCQPVYKTH